MKITGINFKSRVRVYDILSRSKNGSVFWAGDIIMTRLGFLFLVERNNKLAFFTLEEVVEEVLSKKWKE